VSDQTPADCQRPGLRTGFDIVRNATAHTSMGGTMDHAATARHMFELITAGDIDGFAEHLADDFVEHESLPGLAPRKDGVKVFFGMQRAAFPDLRMDAEDVIAGGDKVVTRVRYTGTNKGAFMGMPATGKGVDVQLIDIMRFGDDGRVHEHWGVMDQMTLMQQLGLVPAPPSA
jgi:steroid delta-isomerase-like uncharacterized protein